MSNWFGIDDSLYCVAMGISSINGSSLKDCASRDSAGVYSL